MASGANRTYRGSFISTGSIQQVLTAQFRPRRVKIFNRTTAATLEWNSEFPDDSGLKVVTAGTQTFITSGGVTALPTGFQLGADAQVNSAAGVCVFEVVE